MLCLSCFGQSTYKGIFIGNGGQITNIANSNINYGPGPTQITLFDSDGVSRGGITNHTATLNLSGSTNLPVVGGGNGMTFAAAGILGTGTSSHLLYVSPMGNDSTGVRGDITHPFLTYYAWDGGTPGLYTGVCSNAVSGDTIVALPGVHYAAVIFLKAGVNFIGLGMPTIYRTNVFDGDPFDANLNSAGPLLQPGNNSYVYGVHIVATNGSSAGSFDAPIGVFNQTGLPDSYDNLGFSNVLGTNWLVDHCILDGTSDGIYVNLTGSTQGTNYTGTFQNCTINTGWDTVRLAANAAAKIITVNCTFNAITDSRYATGEARCFVISGGSVLNDVGSTLNFYGTDVNNTWGVSSEANSLVTLTNTIIQPSSLQTTAYSNVFVNTGGTVNGNYTTVTSPGGPSAVAPNLFMAGPTSGRPMTPTFRVLVNSDIPSGLTPVFGSLTIGTATNVASFTLVQTNLIDGATYTNQTGRTIQVIIPCTVTPGTGIGGNATYALKVPGIVTNVLSIGTLATSLAMPQTNFIISFVTNSGTFTPTNLSTGTGSTAKILNGSTYMVF